MSQYRADRRKVEFLRAHGLTMGHTDGTPFSEACISFYATDSIKFINAEYIEEIYKEFCRKAPLVELGIESFTRAEHLIYLLFKDNSIFSAFGEFYENKVDLFSTQPKGD